MRTRFSLIALLSCGLLSIVLCGCASDQKKLADAQAEIKTLRAQVAELKNTNEHLAADLVRTGKPSSAEAMNSQRFDLSPRLLPAKSSLPDWQTTLYPIHDTVLYQTGMTENDTYQGVIIGAGGSLAVGHGILTIAPATKPSSQK